MKTSVETGGCCGDGTRDKEQNETQAASCRDSESRRRVTGRPMANTANLALNFDYLSPLKVNITIKKYSQARIRFRKYRGYGTRVVQKEGVYLSIQITANEETYERSKQKKGTKKTHRINKMDKLTGTTTTKLPIFDDPAMY